MTGWRRSGDVELASHVVSFGGRVLDADAPRRGVTVIARRAGGGDAVAGGYETRTDVRGLFWFEDLPRAKYTVQAAVLDRGGCERRSEVVEVQSRRERTTELRRDKKDAPVWLEIVLIQAAASTRPKGE